MLRKTLLYIAFVLSLFVLWNILSSCSTTSLKIQVQEGSVVGNTRQEEIKRESKYYSVTTPYEGNVSMMGMVREVPVPNGEGVEYYPFIEILFKTNTKIKDIKSIELGGVSEKDGELNYAFRDIKKGMKSNEWIATIYEGENHLVYNLLSDDSPYIRYFTEKGSYDYTLKEKEIEQMKKIMTYMSVVDRNNLLKEMQYEKEYYL